jgi:hypothetical protein
VACALLGALDAAAQDRCTAEEFDDAVRAAFAGRTQEITARRDAYGRHFRNPDGTATAILVPGPIHYRAEDGSWQPIDLHIRPEQEDSTFALSCRTTTIRAFFPARADAVVRMAADDRTYLDWRPLALGWTRGGTFEEHAIPSPSPPSATSNILRYPAIFPDAEDVWEVQPAMVKHDIVLNAPPPIPFDADTLDITGEIRLAPGLSFEAGPDFETNAAAWIVDAAGARVMRIAPVWAQEIASRLVVPGTLRVQPAPNGYRVALRIPAAWLRDPARQYPVRIDPTVWSANGVKVDNSYFYGGLSNDEYWSSWGNTETGAYWADGSYGGSNWYDCAVGRDYDWADEYYRSAADWNTTSIPDSSAVLNTRLNVYVAGYKYSDFDSNYEYANLWSMELNWESRSSPDSHYADCANGTLYASFVYLYTGQAYTGWLDLGPSADATVQSLLGANWFGVGLTFTGSSDRGVITFLDWSTLEVTYNNVPTTPSPLSPANGARTVGKSVAISWSASSDVDGDPITYEL